MLFLPFLELFKFYLCRKLQYTFGTKRIKYWDHMSIKPSNLDFYSQYFYRIFMLITWFAITSIKTDPVDKDRMSRVVLAKKDNMKIASAAKKFEKKFV